MRQSFSSSVSSSNSKAYNAFSSRRSARSCSRARCALKKDCSGVSPCFSWTIWALSSSASIFRSRRFAFTRSSHASFGFSEIILSSARPPIWLKESTRRHITGQSSSKTKDIRQRRRIASPLDLIRFWKLQLSMRRSSASVMTIGTRWSFFSFSGFFGLAMLPLYNWLLSCARKRLTRLSVKVTVFLRNLIR